MKEFDHLSPSELDDILREELDKDMPDRETVLAILGELEAHDPTNVANRPNGFIEDYAAVVNNRECINDPPARSQNKQKAKKWIGTMVAAAVLAIVLLVTVPQTVGAQNIFEIIGRWTADLFKLSNSDEDEREEHNQEEYTFKTENEGLQQLYNAVTEHGVTEAVIPTWIPEGYELQEIKFFDKAKVPKIYANFAKGEKYIQITLEIHSTEATNKYPKDDVNMTIHESAGVFYYIVPNEDNWKTIWTIGNVECVINTNDTKDALYEILNSIQGGNEK